MSRERADADAEPVRVVIYHQPYNLRSPRDGGQVRQAAELVDARMHEVAAHMHGVDAVKIAVLAALNIADELERLREHVSREDARGDATGEAAANETGVPPAEQQDSQDGRQKPSWYEDLFEARPVKSDERLSSLISSKLQMQRQPNPEAFTIEAEEEGK